MASQHCSLLLIGIIQLLVLKQLVLCGKPGPASNVTKHLVFPDFTAQHRVNHEIRLLGNAGLEENSGIIQIPNTQNPNFSFQAGKALYSSPIRMLDAEAGTPATFHTTFSFKIDTEISQGDLDSGSSSGLTFIVVPDEFTVGRPGAWLGMLNDACDENYKAFAVEFDTFKNEEFQDPNDNHVGINLGSIVSNKTVDAAKAGVYFKNGSNVRAWIDYDGVRRWIELRVAMDGDVVPTKALYSSGLDLSKFLNEYMFVGFSASTGNQAQVHKILSWNFSATSNAFLRLPNEETCERKMFKKAKFQQREPSNAFLIFLIVASVFFVVLVYLLCNKKAKNQTKFMATKLILNNDATRPTPPHKPRRFAMSELCLATRNFGQSEILGSGNKGVFYKGVLQNGTYVAIKRFSKHLVRNADKNKIMKEVKLISRLKHPNLVPFKGWCNDKHELLMVYEFMHNGSLDKWLFSRGVLPWPRRYKVVKDIAEAICFLHSGWEKSLVHKNIKINNVLLDITFRAKLGDFGLVGPCSNNSNDQKQEQGLSELKVENHIPPESPHVLQPNEKMDVYNFGVMVLEIVSGRKSMDNDLSPEDVDLVEFSWSLHQEEKLLQVADKRLMMRYNPEQVKCLVEVGLLSTQSDPRSRPTMAEIVSYINGEVPLPPLPHCRPVASFLYPSAPQLCMKSCSPAGLPMLGYKSNK